MSSVRIDGGFWMDPRIVSGHAGDNAAAGVYSRLMSYCGKYNTDTVPAALVAVVAGEDYAVVPALVSTGALVAGADTYRLDPAPALAVGDSNRRRLELLAAGRATAAQIKARVEFYGGLCWICRTAPYQAIDHVKPLARGGSNWPANLRPACKSCNSRKGARWPFEQRPARRPM
jgi:hypothetical protein